MWIGSWHGSMSARGRRRAPLALRHWRLSDHSPTVSDRFLRQIFSHELGNGHIDILVNNAGIFPFGPTHEMTEDVFDSVYALNVKVPYFLVAALAPLMAQRGTGAIVNVSTMVADYGAPGMSLYGSSKAAINLLTKAWAAEYGPSGVRVNAVSPGPTRTEGTEAMGEGLEQLAAQAPVGWPATADEIAEAIVFLATDRASFIFGAKLAVDGGRTAV